eukprot:GHUV01037896.1.p1 GENE.GHUV01037896.1~~GHUV01037896.1.p1  ORF type:complete len:159 (-),score=27.62 GHUV01037896.1:365-841(-)
MVAECLRRAEKDTAARSTQYSGTTRGPEAVKARQGGGYAALQTVCSNQCFGYAYVSWLSLQPTYTADIEGSPFAELGLKDIQDGVSVSAAAAQVQLWGQCPWRVFTDTTAAALVVVFATSRRGNHHDSLENYYLMGDYHHGIVRQRCSSELAEAVIPA